ncbi:hypothetical protein PIB30_034623 [Stylosanthes scabra]|uniref:Retrotransposon gag domain-containing protein n=1 Tax=Stylosanthes scabra TaxID=79078 RepID=A0ABU6XAG6_9FABA|nr:hypothetical protein [Stylosanthes scabra]
MKYDRSTDPHEHLRDFEHQMVCDGAIDEVKCRAFFVTVTELASKWFTSLLTGSISTLSEVKELFLIEFTTSIDNTKHLINLLAVIRRPNESMRKYVERFNEKCYGHKSQDCYDLKDAIEQAIRDGKLNEFTKIIWEPKNTDRERSPRAEAHDPWSQRDEDEEPTTMVNIITGSSAAEKSKSALRNDLKVLATVRTPPLTCPDVKFRKVDYVHGLANADAPLVISTMKLGSGLVQRVLVDMGADSNIMFRNAFDALGIKRSNLKTH